MHRLLTSASLALAIGLALTGMVSADERVAGLYYQGLEDVEATLPSSGLAMPSTTMPCINCHGADGLGGREGGVDVPPISWRHLSMASADRPAYDQSLLARALREGIGAGGETLQAIMPRYAVSDDMAEALADWLKAIQPDETPGVTGKEIAIVVPRSDADDPRAAVVSKVLRHYADEMNRKGGIYGRTLRLMDDVPGRKNVFARLAALEPQARGNSVPNFWPLHLEASGRADFPLMPPAERLMGTLLDLARQDDPSARRLSDLVDDQGVLPRALVFDGDASALSAFIDNWSGPSSLTIYTTPDHADLAHLQRLSPRPLRIILVNPFAPDQADEHSSTGGEVAAFEEAALHLQLPDIARPTARAAWTTASLFEDALRATGRKLDHYRLKAAVHAMKTFDSGLLPPIDPTRGLTSIELVSFDFATGEVTRQKLSLN
ncbi:MAG: hypothetical protein ACRBM6_24260 [Geminicoccales bacterium]